MRPNEETGWGQLGCLRLHFEHFEKLGISQTFNLQNYFFENRVLYFTLFFRLEMRDVTIQKETKVERWFKIRIIRLV